MPSKSIHNLLEGNVEKIQVSQHLTWRRHTGNPFSSEACNLFEKIVQLKSDIGLNKFGTIELWEYQFMWNSLIAAVVFGGFLAETAVPVIAAAQTQKQATEPAAPMTAPPQMKKQTTEPAAPA